MSNVAALDFKQELAEAEAISERRKKASTAAETVAAMLSFRRELKRVDVPGLGPLFVLRPMSVTEREAYHKHTRWSPTGLSQSMLGFVDGIIARARDESGRLVFNESHRDKLLDFSAEQIRAIWDAMGDEPAFSDVLIDAAEKK